MSSRRTTWARRLAVLALLLTSLVGLTTVADAQAGRSDPAPRWNTFGRKLGFFEGLYTGEHLSCPSATKCHTVSSWGSTAAYDGTSWSTPRTVSFLGELSDISCPRPDVCGAVGERRTAFRTADGWRSDYGDYIAPFNLDHIACVSRTHCVAVGRHASKVLTWDGARWGHAVRLSQRHHLLGAISCASDSACLVADSRGGAWRLHRGQWHRHQVLAAGTGGLVDVSCPSTSTCWVASADHRVARWHDGTWDAVRRVAPAGERVTALSCATAGYCRLVDEAGDTVLRSGGRWGSPRHVSATPLHDVSCPTTTTCVALADGESVELSGGAVSRAGFQDTHRVPPIDFGIDCIDGHFCFGIDSRERGFGVGADRLSTLGGKVGTRDTAGGHTAVSCVTDLCVAFDGRDNVVYRTADGSYSRPQPLQGTGWDDVGCADAQMCVGVSTQGTFTTYDGLGWSAPRQLTDAALLTVECPSETECFAGDDQGRVFTYDGSGWSQPRDLTSTDLHDITCASERFCLGVGRGELSYFRQGSWHAPVPFRLTWDVDCATRHSCMAIGKPWLSQHFDGSTWEKPQRFLRLGQQWKRPVLTCENAKTCWAVDLSARSHPWNPCGHFPCFVRRS